MQLNNKKYSLVSHETYCDRRADIPKGPTPLVKFG